MKSINPLPDEWMDEAAKCFLAIWPLEKLQKSKYLVSDNIAEVAFVKDKVTVLHMLVLQGLNVVSLPPSVTVPQGSNAVSLPETQ